MFNKSQILNPSSKQIPNNNIQNHKWYMMFGYCNFDI